MYALNHFPFLQLVFRDTTDAIGAKVRVTSLNASQTADILISGLLPFRDERSIGNLFLDAVVIELFGNGLPLVEQVVHISCPLVVYLEDRPKSFDTALSLVRIIFCFPHLCLQLFQRRLNQFPAIWRWLTSGSPHFGHDDGRAIVTKTVRGSGDEWGDGPRQASE